MQSQSPSSSQQPSRPGSSASQGSVKGYFSVADRTEIYACLRIAKHCLGSKDDKVSLQVYNFACDLMTDEDNDKKLERVPSIKMVKDLLAAVKETGRVEHRKSPGRPLKAGHEETQDLLHSTDRSTRGIASDLRPETDVSHMFVHREAKAQKMRFYRTILGQKLNMDSIGRRLKFALEMHRRIGSQQIDINNVCWTDECMVGTGHSSNRQNDGVWYVQGEVDVDAMLREQSFQGPTVHMFVLVHSRIGVLGPYFIDRLPR